MKPQNDGGNIADGALSHGNGDDGQSVAQNEIRRGHGRGVKALEQGRASILGDNKGGKKGHKGKTENGDAGGEVLYLEKRHGDIGLNGAEEQYEHQGETETEEKGEGIPEDFLGVSKGER